MNRKQAPRFIGAFTVMMSLFFSGCSNLSYISDQIENFLFGTQEIDITEYDEVSIPEFYRPDLATDTTGKMAYWTGGTKLRGANIYQRKVYPELDGNVYMGKGFIGPPYTQEDFDRLSALGANYVNISHPGIFTEEYPYRPEEEGIQNLDMQKFNLIFIDGHHNKKATLNYFNSLLDYIDNDSIIIIDDIHWSRDMLEAWEIIKKNKQVTLTIDTFYWGLVFFRKEQAKEDFIIRV